MEDLEQYRVKRAPTDVYYVPEFLTPAEEERLWRSVYAAPKPKWTTLSNRRLQNWGGLPHEKGMVSEPLPQWLSEFTDRVSALGVFGTEGRTANHVLINEYKPGQGIMMHEDGPLFYPTICTLNVGAHTLLNLYSPPNGEEGQCVPQLLGGLLLEPRSLLLLRGAAYTSTLHGISDTSVDLLTADRTLNWGQTGLGGREGDTLAGPQPSAGQPQQGQGDIGQGDQGDHQSIETFVKFLDSRFSRHSATSWGTRRGSAAVPPAGGDDDGVQSSGRGGDAEREEGSNGTETSAFERELSLALLDYSSNGSSSSIMNDYETSEPAAATISSDSSCPTAAAATTSSSDSSCLPAAAAAPVDALASLSGCSPGSGVVAGVSVAGRRCYLLQRGTRLSFTIRCLRGSQSNVIEGNERKEFRQRPSSQEVAVLDRSLLVQARPSSQEVALPQLQALVYLSGTVQSQESL